MKGCALVFLLCFVYVYGATFRSKLKTDIVNGKAVIYCETRQIRVPPGTVFQDYFHCSDCTCSGDGLSCQTMAGRITAPSNSQCISKLKNCKNHWVRRSNENEECPIHLIPTNITMVGK